MDFLKIGIVIVAMIMCIGISEYQMNKPVKLTKDVIIHPSVVLKRIFMSDGYVRPEIKKSAGEGNVDKVSKGSVKMVSRGVPRGSSGEFKSYLPYHLITNKSSKAYQLQQDCWTDGLGFRRWGEFYCVALGSKYSTSIGDKFKITFDTGVDIYVILADCKSDAHTDKTKSYNTFNGNVCEFLVDKNKIHPMAKRMGDVSYGNDELKGGIVKIEQVIEGDE